MNHDEHQIDKRLRKFSVAKQCPKCRQLTLTFMNSRIYCRECGYEEPVPSLR